MKIEKLLILPLFFLLVLSCNNDDDIVSAPVNNGVNNTNQLANYNPPIDMVNASLVGTIIDESDNPISDATISHQGKQYTTNQNGIFVIKDESFNSNGAFIRVAKGGFFQGSRRFYPQENSTNYIRVQLLALNNIGKFDATTGGSITGEDDLEITFPANSIQTEESGLLYTGSVSVAARWLNPAFSNINDIMPGDLTGVNVDIQEVSLVSYSMMAVEIFGDNGQKLNLAPENEATLTFPVHDILLANAPQEIPLWSFEEERFGIWVEEGSARLEGNKYIGQVSHFSFWNCDAPFDVVEISGRLVATTGAPIVNAKMVVRAEDLETERCGYTDNRGFFNGKFPRDFTWNIRASPGYAYGDCGFQSFTFGPFTDADPDGVNLGSIPLQALEIEDFEVIGSIVDCDNNPVSNGLLNIAVGNNVQTILVDEGSNFQVSILNCESHESFSIRATDIDALEIGSTIHKPINPTANCGPLRACGTSVCVTENKFVGDYMLTIEGASGLGYGPGYVDRVVSVFLEEGSNSVRSFQCTMFPEAGSYGPYKTTFEVLCDKAIFQLMDTEGLGCGGGGVLFGPAFDKNGTIISEPLDPNDDSRVVLFFNEGFANGGCPGFMGETATKMVLTKL